MKSRDGAVKFWIKSTANLRLDRFGNWIPKLGFRRVWKSFALTQRFHTASVNENQLLIANKREGAILYRIIQKENNEAPSNDDVINHNYFILNLFEALQKCRKDRTIVLHLQIVQFRRWRSIILPHIFWPLVVPFTHWNETNMENILMNGHTLPWLIKCQTLISNVWQVEVTLLCVKIISHRFDPLHDVFTLINWVRI